MKKTTVKRTLKKKPLSFSADPIGMAMEVAKNFSESDYKQIAATVIDRIQDTDYRKMASNALKDVDYKQLAKSTLKVVVPLIVMKVIYNRAVKPRSKR